tara:strand:- start:1474 stop:2079 length:606 start_codon:yes stop_codon:yes gene_type:complete
MKQFPNFISIYDNALTKNECELIINEFESNKDIQVEGKSGNYEIQPKVKKSIDIGYRMNDNSVTSSILSKSLNHHIELYKEEYPDLTNLIYPWECMNLYNIQKYLPKGGYFSRHCEVASIVTSNRVLVWMFYLNTVPNGGTLFPSYEIGTNAVQGRLVLWPAYWTHGHKGQISDTHIKYIATGWHIFTEKIVYSCPIDFKD